MRSLPSYPSRWLHCTLQPLLRVTRNVPKGHPPLLRGAKQPFGAALVHSRKWCLLRSRLSERLCTLTQWRGQGTGIIAPSPSPSPRAFAPLTPLRSATGGTSHSIYSAIQFRILLLGGGVNDSNRAFHYCKMAANGMPSSLLAAILSKRQQHHSFAARPCNTHWTQ